jgi:OmpA-like transmembrane domain
MKRRVPGLAAVLCVGALGSSAEAGDNGFYVGGSFGVASKDTPVTEYQLLADFLYEEVFRYTPTSGAPSFDDSDTSYSLLVGYRLNRYLALEGGYARLGQLSYRSFTSGEFPNDRGEVNLSMDSETSGFAVAAVGVLPLNYSWEIYGRAGMLFATNDFTLTIRARGDVFAQPSGAESFSKSSEDVYAGLGVSFRFFDIYDVRLEYQRYFDAGTEITMNKGDIDVASLGLIVTF